MRIVQILAFGVFAALVVACGAWALAWFGTSPGPPSAIQAASEPKSPKSTVVLEVAPERQSEVIVNEGDGRQVDFFASQGIVEIMLPFPPAAMLIVSFEDSHSHSVIRARRYQRRH